MRASNTLHLYSVIFLCLATLTAAWPWPRWLPEMDSLIARQDSGNNSQNSTQTTPASKTDSSPPKQTDSTTVKSISNTNTVTPTGKQSDTQASGTNTNSKGASTTKKPQSSVFDARLPAGGVSIISPNALSGSQYYKIGDLVTFAWNYTSLLATPTAINIVATCTANQQLYTLAANQTVSNATGAVTWDTGAYQSTALSAPLLTETYTLIIYDAASSISATAQAGYLAVYNQFKFSMYLPQPYVPLGEYICATCSGALGDMERRALGMVLGVGAITILSFTWFVGGSGVIW